jgi:hypothetical protein
MSGTPPSGTRAGLIICTGIRAAEASQCSKYSRLLSFSNKPTHQIAVAGLGKDDEDDEALGRGSTITRARGDEIVGSGRSLPLTDIRRNQQKVERRYGSFVLSGRDRCAAATTRRK